MKKNIKTTPLAPVQIIAEGRAITLPSKAMDPRTIREGMYVRSKKNKNKVFWVYYTFGHHEGATFKAKGFQAIFPEPEVESRKYTEEELPLYNPRMAHTRFKIEYDNSEARPHSGKTEREFAKWKAKAIKSSVEFLKRHELIEKDELLSYLRSKLKSLKGDAYDKFYAAKEFVKKHG